MQEKLKDTPVGNKIVAFISISASIVVVLFAAFQLFDVLDDSINVCVPLLGVINSCQAYLQWNANRKLAYFSIGTAVFIFICAFVVFFVK